MTKTEPATIFCLWYGQYEFATNLARDQSVDGLIWEIAECQRLRAISFARRESVSCCAWDSSLSTGPGSGRTSVRRGRRSPLGRIRVSKSARTKRCGE